MSIRTLIEFMGIVCGVLLAFVAACIFWGLFAKFCFKIVMLGWSLF